MGSMITIDDGNYRSFLGSSEDRPDGMKGLVPRDFGANPQGYLKAVAEPFNIPVFSVADIEARIKEQLEQKSSLTDIRETGNFGNRIPALDQNGQGYCWAYSTTSATMLTRARQGQPYKRLSGHMIGCIIKGYRNEGGWNAQSLKFATEKGIASVDTWAEKSMQRSNDTPAMWEDAAKQRVTEWWDLSDNGSTVKLQLATLLLLNIPVMVDFNWWSHSVCAMQLLSWSPFKVLILNSWGDGWSDNGAGILVDGKAIPNGAAAPRVAMAA